jgi:hypothetical protein
VNWQPLAAILLSLWAKAGDSRVTIPTPRLYQDENVIVTLRPALDLDLNYVGVSFMIRPTPTRRHVH